jgi:hypothetical protein
LTGSLVGNRPKTYKCTNVVMEHDHTGHNHGQPGHMPTIGHTRQRQTALTLTTSSAREICRACADRALHRPPVPRHRCRRDSPPQLRFHSDTAERKRTHRTRRKDWLTKPSPRPKLCSPHHRCQTTRNVPGQQPRQHAIISGAQAEVGSETMTPRRKKAQIAPPLPDPKDLRFPSRANHGRQRAQLHGDASNKVRDTHSATVAGSSEGCNKNSFWSCNSSRPATSASPNANHLPCRGITASHLQADLTGTNPERRCLSSVSFITALAAEEDQQPPSSGAAAPASGSHAVQGPTSSHSRAPRDGRRPARTRSGHLDIRVAAAHSSAHETQPHTTSLKGLRPWSRCP